MSKMNTANKNAAERSLAGSKQNALTELSQRAPKTGKQKPIPIRHTLTSKLRMVKSNPLLGKSVMDTKGSSLSQVMETPTRRSTFQPGIFHVKQKLDFKLIGPMSESRSTLKKPISQKERQSISSRLFKENNPKLVGSHMKSKPANVQSAVRVPKQSLTEMAKTTRTIVSNKSNCLPIQTKNSLKTTMHSSLKLNSQSNKTRASEPKRVASKDQSLREGSTLGFRVPSSLSNVSNKTAVKKPQLKSILRRSVSAGDLRKGTGKNEQTSVLGGIENKPLTPKILNKSVKSVAFYSPLHNSTFSPLAITNTPPPSVLRKRLESWLQKRGKSSYSYHHLCCFGLSKTDTISQPQESRLDETITLESSDSTVILSQSHDQNGIDIEDTVPNGSSTPEKENTFNMEDKENNICLAHPEALIDLRKLVYSGYPRDQCEQWFHIISRSDPALKELPQYWECLAALEESRGDFGSAVDCYGKAIVRGADAGDVDKRLDELWEKFSVLSVNASQSKRTPTRKKGIDPKQIFKSTVIKFALQQKAVKKFSKETGVSIPSVSYIVTPVRRSSRRSQSQFRSTPTVTCVDTLDDLEQTVRETMEFHGNDVLNPGN